MKFDLSNKLVFVTGFDGFLGFRLVGFLLEKGATVIGLRFNIPGNEERTRKLSANESFYLKSFGENLDDILADSRFKNYQTECFHFAGIASAVECQNNPNSAYKGNVLLTLDVLEYCRLIGVNKFIFPSTGYVYGNRLDEPAGEMNRLISTNVYTSTKIAAEALIESYSNYYDMDCTVGRISNIFGRESSTETVSGKIINCINKKKKVVLNTLKPVRDFIYIDDVINAFLTISTDNKENMCSYYNISTGSPTSINNLAETACRMASLPLSYVVSKKIRQYSDTCLVLDNSKIKKATDWKPEYTLEAGLSEVLDEVVK